MRCRARSWRCIISRCSTSAPARWSRREALLRWPHRSGGAVAPSAFLPIAEQSSLIVEIGGWAMRNACREAACWRDRALRVSVNVAARQLKDCALLRQAPVALEASGLAPERLEFELPEEMLIDVDADTLLGLAALRDLGIGLSLKEFGHRYGSLSALRRLPLTGLKLDRTLVRNLPDDKEEAAIIGATVGAAHALGLMVTAEGVETEDQRAFLSGIGCDLGQGFLFSPAMSADRFRSELAGHKEVTED